MVHSVILDQMSFTCLGMPWECCGTYNWSNPPQSADEEPVENIEDFSDIYLWGIDPDTGKNQRVPISDELLNFFTTDCLNTSTEGNSVFEELKEAAVEQAHENYYGKR